MNKQQQISDRPAPYSEEVEEAVLGAVLTNPNAFFTVKDIIKDAEAFYILRHQYIWEAIERIVEQGEEFDYLTVSKELQDIGRLDEVGGPWYLLRLVNNTPTSVHADIYAKTVEHAAQRRKLMAVADEIKALALNEEMPIEEVTSEAEMRLNGAVETSRHRVVWGATASDDYEDVLEARREAAKNGEFTLYPVPDSWKTLKKYIPGFPSGKLIVVSGASGTGKSAALEQIGENLAQYEVLADFIHTEMSKEDVQDRRMARHAGIAYHRLLQPNLLTPSELERKDEVRVRMDSWLPNWTCHAMPDAKFSDLATTMLNRVRRGVKVFLIDHFQDISIPSGKGENEIRAIEKIAIWLTAFAESRNVLVVVASQENTQGGTKWSAKLTEKAAMRISIKQTVLQNSYAYHVGDLEYRLNPGDTDPNCSWVIGKSRFGKRGKVPMFQHGPAFSWMDNTEVSRSPNIVLPRPALDPSVFGRDEKWKN